MNVLSGGPVPGEGLFVLPPLDQFLNVSKTPRRYNVDEKRTGLISGFSKFGSVPAGDDVNEKK